MTTEMFTESQDILQDILDSPRRNSWLRFNSFDVYVRVSVRYHQGLKRNVNCFDIANINVHTPGKGTFTKWLLSLGKILEPRGFEAIYVESVQNQLFAAHLRTIGMYEVSSEYDVNFFKMLKA